MKIKQMIREETCCGDVYQYQLDGWDEDDWMCADCFLMEMINNDYQVTPQFNAMERLNSNGEKNGS